MKINVIAVSTIMAMASSGAMAGQVTPMTPSKPSAEFITTIKGLGAKVIATHPELSRSNTQAPTLKETK